MQRQETWSFVLPVEGDSGAAAHIHWGQWRSSNHWVQTTRGRVTSQDEEGVRTRDDVHCVVRSYGEPRREPLDIFQGDINCHNTQDELVLGFLMEKPGRKK